MKRQERIEIVCCRLKIILNYIENKSTGADTRLGAILFDLTHLL